MPEDLEHGTVVLIHGAPGSHNDFKYVLPFFKEKNIRVIGINFPGFGLSTSDDRFQNNHYEREQFLQGTLNALKISNNLVFVGHIRGCVDALRLTANKKNKCVGIVVANSVGLRAHRVARPFWVINFATWLFSFSFLRFIWLPILNFYFNNVLGFQTTGSVSGVIVQTMSHTHFAKLRDYIEVINSSDIRVLVPFSGNDLLIETEISRELANVFSHNKELKCLTKYDDDEIIDEAIKAFNSGEKHLSVHFEKENHFLQKHRAKFLGRLIYAMLN